MPNYCNLLKLNPGVTSLDLILLAEWESHQTVPNVERENAIFMSFRSEKVCSEYCLELLLLRNKISKHFKM